jgi:hypothetical protein
VKPFTSTTVTDTTAGVRLVGTGVAEETAWKRGMVSLGGVSRSALRHALAPQTLVLGVGEGEGHRLRWSIDTSDHPFSADRAMESQKQWRF